MRLLFLLMVTSLFAGETLHYKVKNGETVVQSRWFIQGEKLELFRESETQTYHVNDQHETTQFALFDTTVQSNYTVRREGNRLHLKGIVRGKEVDKTEKIDDSPWLQSVHDLSEFALDNNTELSKTFWLVRPVDLKVVKMRAVIEEDRSDSHSITVKIAPVGMMSLLWRAYYTYRTSDGRFVEYRSIHGPPGTPETVVSLI